LIRVGAFDPAHHPIGSHRRCHAISLGTSDLLLLYLFGLPDH
jgi:hypothetical protein